MFGQTGQQSTNPRISELYALTDANPGYRQSDRTKTHQPMDYVPCALI
jgi:hypothetical protein